MPDIEIIKGLQVGKDDLKTINYWRKKEFASKTTWNKKNHKAYFKDIVFLLREAGCLLAFGRLRPLTVYTDNKPEEIWGISAIVAITKGVGYGKKLMQEISLYITENPRTAIGFCGKENTGFYRKCGFQIIPGGQKYFIYIDEADNKHYEEGDVFYQDARGKLIKYLSEAEKPIVCHYVPHW